MFIDRLLRPKVNIYARLCISQNGRPQNKECVFENYFSYFSFKTCVVGAQKNRLNETVLLSTQNTSLNWWIRK